MQLSFSRMQTFNQCGLKYYFRYIERLDSIFTFSSLVFGTALDSALNGILESKQHGMPPDIAKAKEVLKSDIEKINADSLLYTKKESPIENDGHNVKLKLIKSGEEIIDVYCKDILPQIDEVISVQNKIEIHNNVGDSFVAIIDFVGKKDNVTVIFDNKTTSDIKKYYRDDSARKSHQLAIYSELYGADWVGYVALEKSTNENKIIVDKIDSEFRDSVFEEIDLVLRKIKAERFQRNTKNCFSFGRKCEFFEYCKNGDKSKVRERP